MIDSPLTARVAVYDSIKDYGGGEFVSKGDKRLKRPAAVSVGTDGMTPDFYRVAVRIWIALDEQNLGPAYDLLDEHLAGVDQALGNGGFGPSDWIVEGQDDPPVIIATCVLELGRDDVT